MNEFIIFVWGRGKELPYKTLGVSKYADTVSKNSFAPVAIELMGQR